MMLKIELQTNDGGFVENVSIPPFVTLPVVLIWGNRFFKQHDKNVYRECFGVVALDVWRGG